MKRRERRCGKSGDVKRDRDTGESRRSVREGVVMRRREDGVLGFPKIGNASWTFLWLYHQFRHYFPMCFTGNSIVSL